MIYRSTTWKLANYNQKSYSFFPFSIQRPSKQYIWKCWCDISKKIECSFKCNKIKYLNNKRINRIYIFFHKVCAKGQLFKLFSTSNQSNLKTGPIAKISSLFSLLSLNENKWWKSLWRILLSFCKSLDHS